MTAPRLDLAELRRLWVICDDSANDADWNLFEDAAHDALPALLSIAEAAEACRQRGDLLPHEIRAVLAAVRKEEKGE